MYFKDERDEKILKFIQLNQPCNFGDIQKHLKKIKCAYRDNKGLSKKLGVLMKKDLIVKNSEAKPYPTYSTIQNYAADTAIMGDLFKMNYTKTFFTPVVEIDDDYIKNDIPLNQDDTENEKIIKSMVTRYGFYIFSALVKSFESQIKLKNFDRKIWLKNAFDLIEDEEKISSDFLDLLDIPFDYPKSKIQHYDEDEEILDIEEHPEFDELDDEEPEYHFESMEDPPVDLSKRNNKKLLKEKLQSIRESMDETYPKMSQCVRNYDFYFESNPEKIRKKDFNKINRKNWPEI